MIRLLTILGALLLAFAPVPAPARLGRAAPPPPTSSFCPSGDLNPDGCGQSSIVTQNTDGAQHLSNCWGAGGTINQIAGTSTNYTTGGNPTAPPSGSGSPWNSAGCEYGVGAWTPIAQLANPIHSGASVIPGCTYSATGSFSGGAHLSCSGSSVPQYIEGYDFGPVTGTDAHGCISVQISGLLSTAAQAYGEYIINNHWQNDGNCLQTTQTAVFLNLPTTSGQPYHIWNNTFDGNAETYPDNWGQCSPSAGNGGCNATSAILGGSTADGGFVDAKYNTFLNFVGRPFNVTVLKSGTGTANGAGLTFCYNYVQSWSITYPTSHGEFTSSFFAPGAGVGNLCYNTIVEGTLAGSTQLAPWPTNFGAGSYSAFNVDHNTFIGGVTGGSTTGTIGASTIAAGTNVLTIPACTGGPPCPATIGTGQVIGSCTASGITAPGAGWSGIGTIYPSALSGQTSAGPGGGYNWNPASGSSQWNIGWDSSSFDVTGYIDNGLGSAGNQLTVTLPGVLNIQALNPSGVEATISGSGITTAQVTAGSSSPYTISGSPQLVGSVGSPVVINVTIPDDYVWTAGANITCSGGTLTTTTSSLWFTDLSGNNGGGGYATATGASIAPLGVSTSTLTLGAVTAGTIYTGLTVSGPGVTSTTVASGSGLSWVINNRQTVAGPVDVTFQGGSFATATGASISGNTLTLGAVSSGTVTPYLQVTGPGVTPGTTVQSGSGLSWQVTPSQTIAGPITVQFGLPSFGPPPAGYASPVNITNNLVDPSSWGAGYGNGGFVIGGGNSGGGLTCTSPSTLSGNADVSGLYSSSFMNTLHSVSLQTAQSGC